MDQNDNHIKQEDEDLSRTLDGGKPLYEIGSRIGGYKVLSVLGEGGFGGQYPRKSRRPFVACRRRVRLKRRL